MRTITVAEFQAELKGQGVSSIEHVAFRCPMCNTLQSPRDLMEAGAGRTVEEVERFVAFSCVGRWLKAPGPRKSPDGKPCDWTLGGLFSLHRLEVVTPDGTRHPRFEPATGEDARAHEASWRATPATSSSDASVLE